MKNCVNRGGVKMDLEEYIKAKRLVYKTDERKVTETVLGFLNKHNFQLVEKNKGDSFYFNGKRYFFGLGKFKRESFDNPKEFIFFEGNNLQKFKDIYKKYLNRSRLAIISGLTGVATLVPLSIKLALETANIFTRGNSNNVIAIGGLLMLIYPTASVALSHLIRYKIENSSKKQFFDYGPKFDYEALEKLVEVYGGGK